MQRVASLFHDQPHPAHVHALAPPGVALHADAAAGKAKFEAQCAECHEAGDFEGTAAKEIGETLTHMAAGHVKHKTPIKLSAAEIAAVAAYLSGGK